MTARDDGYRAGAPRRFRFTPQLFAGLLIMAAGVLLTLDNLGVLAVERVLRYWPAALVAIGALKVWGSRDHLGGSLGGFLFLVIGAWLLLERAALIHISFWDMWPALLVAFGLFLVWQGLAPAAPRGDADAHAFVRATTVLGGTARGNNSRAFRGGEVTVIMGGCELDLRHAAIEGEAVLEVFALWGGIEIRVPEDWTVIARVTPVLGGVDDKTRPPQGLARHRLVVRGLVMMAGVEVKN